MCKSHYVNVYMPVVYLAISTIFELLCILLYVFFFPNLPIVKYYRTKAAREGSKTVLSDLNAAGVHLDVHVSWPISINRLLLKNLTFS